MSNNKKKIITVRYKPAKAEDSSIFWLEDFVKQSDLWYVSVKQHCLIWQVKYQWITYITQNLSIARYSEEFGFDYGAFIEYLYAEFGIQNEDGLRCIPEGFIIADQLFRKIEFFPARCWIHAEEQMISAGYIKLTAI
jgi:hypothetical protein